MSLLSIIVLSVLQLFLIPSDNIIANLLKLVVLLKLKSIDRIVSKLQFLYASTTSR
jgi:hypothetical protein